MIIRIGKADSVHSASHLNIRFAVKSHQLLIENTHPTIRERQYLFKPFNLVLTFVKGLDETTGYMYAGYGVHGTSDDDKNQTIRKIVALLYRTAAPSLRYIMPNDYREIERIERNVDLSAVSPDYDSLFRIMPTVEHVDFAARLESVYRLAIFGPANVLPPDSEVIYNVGTHFIRVQFPDMALTAGVLRNPGGLSCQSCERCRDSLHPVDFMFAHRIVLLAHIGDQWSKLPVTPKDIHEYLHHSGSTFERIGEPIPINEDVRSHRSLFGITGSLL